MKKKTMLAGLLLVMGLMFALAGCGGSGESSDAGEAAAQPSGSEISFQATDLDGNAVDSGELFTGSKITMINIWGTYCGPCIEEMPELERINQEYADQGVRVVGLLVDVTDTDDTMLAEAESIVRDTGVTYPSLKSWEGCGDQFPASAIPTTYFVDSSGKLVGEPIVGADVMSYRQTLDELLAK